MMIEKNIKEYNMGFSDPRSIYIYIPVVNIKKKIPKSLKFTTEICSIFELYHPVLFYLIILFIVSLIKGDCPISIEHSYFFRTFFLPFIYGIIFYRISR